MGRGFIVLLLVVALAYGTSQASALLFWFMGPWTSVAIEHDGTVMRTVFDRNLPRPEWIAVYPGATIVDASFSTSRKMPSGFGALEISTGGSYESVRQFYIDRLTEAGFRVIDRDIQPLNPVTAAFLGIAGALIAIRASTDDQADVMIRTPDGLMLSRLVQIHWRKISETPVISAKQR